MRTGVRTDKVICYWGTTGEGALGARAPSFISHFDLGHRSKQGQHIDNWAKAKFNIILPTIDTCAPPPPQITQLGPGRYDFGITERL